MKDDLDQFIESLDTLDEKIERIGDRLQKHNSRYREIARTVAKQILDDLRPDDIEHSIWQNRISRFCNLILIESLSNGFNISYNGRDQETSISNNQAISYEDILEWVEAGMNGNPEGKNIEQYEAGRSAKEIALTVHTATNQQQLSSIGKDYTNLRSAIQEYLNHTTEEGFDAFLEQIAQSWLITFSEIVEHDIDLEVEAILKSI